MRSSQLKNKITDTSLFAELVKDRQKRELELKKLETMLEKKGNQSNASETPPIIKEVPKPNKNGEKSEPSSEPWTPMESVDVVDIPFPIEAALEVPEVIPVVIENCVPVNDIPTPINIPVPPETKSTTPVPRSLTPTFAPIVVKPLTPTKPPPAPLPAPVPKKAEPAKPAKQKLTKLPMPPGIKQADLEAIESPPSRTPSPAPGNKAKTPPRKSGIMNLPMPPGETINHCCLNNNNHNDIS